MKWRNLTGFLCYTSFHLRKIWYQGASLSWKGNNSNQLSYLVTLPVLLHTVTRWYFNWQQILSEQKLSKLWRDFMICTEPKKRIFHWVTNRNENTLGIFITKGWLTENPNYNMFCVIYKQFLDLEASKHQVLLTRCSTECSRSLVSAWKFDQSWFTAFSLLTLPSRNKKCLYGSVFRHLVA